MFKADVRSHANRIANSLMRSFMEHDQFWISIYESALVYEKRSIKFKVYELLKSELKNIDRYDAEGTALFLDFMKRHKLLTFDNTTIGL